jgi:CHAT domain-containing protein
LPSSRCSSRLARAQQCGRERKPYAPYFWAPFVLMGNWQ